MATETRKRLELIITNSQHIIHIFKTCCVNTITHHLKNSFLIDKKNEAIDPRWYEFKWTIYIKGKEKTQIAVFYVTIWALRPRWQWCKRTVCIKGEAIEPMWQCFKRTVCIKGEAIDPKWQCFKRTVCIKGEAIYPKWQGLSERFVLKVKL